MSTSATTTPPTRSDPKESPAAPTAAHPQWLPLAIGSMASIGLVVATAIIAGAEIAALAVLGLALGLTLFHSRFGFTSAWRQLVAVGQSAGVRAHTIMLAAASVLFAPILASGTALFGNTAEGNVEPLSWGLLVGAVLFGIGMQLGGACASGTLFTIGGGNTLIVITLLFFICGSVLGALHMPWWTADSRTLNAVSLATDTGLGYTGALVVQLLVLAAIGYATWRWTRHRGAPPAGTPPTAAGWRRAFRGSWPLWVGALTLAVLNTAVLLTRGSPWGITSGFVLWGSRGLQMFGVDVASWQYWQGDKAETLAQPVLADSTSVLNFGIIIGALVASAASGAFVLAKRPPARAVLAAVIGGLLMGYGSRLAYGCNIGAYFSGIASFSLHGWAWAVLALLGTWIGLKLRPLFGLGVPQPGDSSC